MPFMRGSDYLALPREAGTWIISDILPVGGILNIYGKPKTGKSYLALQMANAIVDPNKDAFLGFTVNVHGPVAYLQQDTSRPVWQERLDGLVAYDPTYDSIMMADSLLTPYPFDMLREGGEWLELGLKEITPDPSVVIIDTIREVHSGDENDSGHMKAVIGLVQKVCRPAAVVVIAHSRKDNGDSADLMDDIRGSSYLPGRMDAVIRVSDTSLHYQSRSVGQTRLQIGRDPETGLFVLNDDFDRAAREIVKASPTLSTMDKARMLRELYPKKSLEACRSMIRRLEPKVTPVKDRAVRAINIEARL